MLETVEHSENARRVEERKVRLERLERLKSFRLYRRGSEEEELLVQTAGFCFECGDDIVTDPECLEVVCLGCGRVWGRCTVDERIPIDEGNVSAGHAEGSYSPEGHLDWGNGLGSKNDRGIIADVLGGRKNPLSWVRSNHVRVSLSHPFIQKLLSFGSEFCNKHDLHQKHNVNHARFADQLGINLRSVGEYYVNGLGKQWADPYRISACIFTLLFRECYPERYKCLRLGNDGAAEKYPELFMSEELLEYYSKLLKSCNPPVLPQLR